MSNILVFTDLDGTLLDHDNYSFKDAIPALKILKNKEIPTILVSSKTQAEMKIIHKEMDLNGYPYIFENGSGIFYKNQIYEFGTSIKAIHKVLLALMNFYNFKFYSTLPIKKAINLTGLKLEQCKNSQIRLFSEPIIWMDSDISRHRFIKDIETQGLKASQGGRFLTISSHHDKADALKWVKSRYEEGSNSEFTAIGLGDGENDINMINVCNTKILIKNNNAHLKQDDWIMSNMPGPKGWGEEVIKAIKKYE